MLTSDEPTAQHTVGSSIVIEIQSSGLRAHGTSFFRSIKQQHIFPVEKRLYNIELDEIKEFTPLYFFTNKDFKSGNKYETGFSAKDIFNINGVGICSKRDKIAYNLSKEDLIRTLKDFNELDIDEIKSIYNVKTESRDQKVIYAKENICEYGIKEQFLAKANYRPFDIRWTYYTDKVRGFLAYPVYNIMKHFFTYENVGLVVSKRNRQVSTGYVFITNKITDLHILDNAQDSTYLFPLYLYDEENTILNEIGKPNRKPNLNMETVNKIADNLGLKFTPEKEETLGTFAPIDIFDYIYAVLHSPTYREKYKEFLKIDFPRVPYPQDTETFWKLVELGGELRQIHLLESPLVENYITTYPEDGSNEVKKVSYDNGKVWINDKQYFENVPQVAWEFYIGGYQPAQKWLKDRKGRVLGFDDVRHYQKIIVALVETDRIMKEIDKIVDM